MQVLDLMQEELIHPEMLQILLYDHQTLKFTQWLQETEQLIVNIAS